MENLKEQGVSMIKTIDSYIDYFNSGSFDRNEFEIRKDQIKWGLKKLNTKKYFSRKQIKEINSLFKLSVNDIFGGDSMNKEKENILKILEIMKNAVIKFHSL